jgi:hypothetical protein
MTNKALNKFGYLLMAATLVFYAAACGHAQTGHKDGHDAKGDHHADVMKNGEKAMGFSQTATTHHFLLMKDGGAIRVEANDAADKLNRDKIRKHLTGIAAQFTEGIFSTPFAVHGRVPPGAAVMEELKSDIEYKFEETENGAQVRISTKNAKALAAVHSFLKFQIEEHETGDPLTPGK